MYFDEVKYKVVGRLKFFTDDDIINVINKANNTPELITLIQDNTELNEQEAINYIISCI